MFSIISQIGGLNLANFLTKEVSPFSIFDFFEYHYADNAVVRFNVRLINPATQRPVDIAFYIASHNMLYIRPVFTRNKLSGRARHEINKEFREHVWPLISLFPKDNRTKIPTFMQYSADTVASYLGSDWDFMQYITCQPTLHRFDVQDIEIAAGPSQSVQPNQYIIECRRRGYRFGQGYVRNSKLIINKKSIKSDWFNLTPRDRPVLLPPDVYFKIQETMTEQLNKELTQHNHNVG